MGPRLSTKILAAFFLGVVTATGIVGVIAYRQYSQLQDEMRISSSAIIFSDTYYMVDTMHHILIDDSKGLFESNATHSAEFALLMDKWLAEEDLSEKEREWFEMQLTLMSVMSEKFEIEVWNKNDNLKDAFERIQEKQPEKVDGYRCRNWSKPMWLDFGCDVSEER